MRPLLERLWAARRALAFYAVLFAAGWVAGEWLMNVAIPEMRPMNEPLIHRLLLGALTVFVLAAAVPFVPGAEIGLVLLVIFGAQASPIVYAGMVGALMLSYSIARFVPLHVLSQLAQFLRLRRFARFTLDLADTPAPERADFMSRRLDSRFGLSMLRNRYLVLAIILNLPGNSILGGGGGLAFLAGVSGLYKFWPYLITVLISVAPLPLLFMMLGGNA